MQHVFLLHGTLGLLDDAFYVAALGLAVLALVFFMVSMIQERKRQTAPVRDQDHEVAD
jgi:hypothetical protein